MVDPFGMAAQDLVANSFWFDPLQWSWNDWVDAAIAAQGGINDYDNLIYGAEQWVSDKVGGGGYGVEAFNATILVGGAGPLFDVPNQYSALAAETGAGGIGPVLQGQRGVATAIGQIEGEGGQVLGSEITIDAGGVRARPDLLIQNADGSLSFVEVKTGGGVLTGNQQVVYPLIEQGGAVPAGANAAAAGLTPGVPLPPMPVRIIKLP